MSTLWPVSGGNCHRHNSGGNANRHVATLIKQGLIQGKVGAESWLPFSLRRRYWGEEAPMGWQWGSPCCERSEPVTGHQDYRNLSPQQGAGMAKQQIAVPGCDWDWHHPPRDQPPQAGVRDNAPGWKGKSPIVNQKKPQQVVWVLTFCELTKWLPRNEQRGLVHPNPFG